MNWRLLLIISIGLVLLAGCEPSDEAAEPDEAAEKAAVPEPEPTAGVDRYLSPHGDDLAAGTEDAPWRTFEHSLAALEPGDTLWVMQGWYEERVTDVPLRQGTEDSPIRVLAHEDDEPVLRGLLWLVDATHWHIEGLSVTWDPDANRSDEHMVKFEGGSNWSFVGNDLWGAQSFSALLVAEGPDGSPDGWRVAENCVSDTYATNRRNQDHLLYINAGDGGHGVVERNLLFNAPNGEGIKIGGEGEGSGTANVVVRHNTIHNAAPQSVLIAWDSQDNDIYGNIFSTVTTGRPAVRAFELNGRDNVVAENLVHEVEDVTMSDDGFSEVVDGGGNVRIDPEFDNTDDCGGFRPGNPDARAYGHLAPVDRAAAEASR